MERFKPPTKLTISQWSDQYRKLSPEASAEPGRWQTSRAEYLRAIMDAISNPEVERVVLMKSAQTGGTEVLNNVVGYYIDQDPSPILLVQPTLEMAKAWSKDRLAPMVRDTDALSRKISDSKSRDGDNTILHKVFPGGHITMAGANSPASLASRPIRITLFDEVDRFPLSAGTEGDPVALGRKRSTTFWNRKSVEVSTPTVKDQSRIEASFKESNQQFYHVQCPHCHESQKLKWSQVQWAEDEPEDAIYVCELSGCVITDADKNEMLTSGVWIAENLKSKIMGFHISELYSPWVTFGQMAASFVEAKKLPETLKTWINTALGETWEEEGEDIDDDALSKRRETYPASVPDNAFILTAGIDVQNDRLEMEVTAWGDDFESWSVDYFVLSGDPAQDEVWQELDEHLTMTFDHESGIALPITAAAIDTGGSHTKRTYDFCRGKFMRRIYAVKGASTPGKPLSTRPSKNNSGNVRLHLLGTDTAKEIIYARLRITEPGAGYCHYPSHYDAAYFEGLASEKLVTKYVKGRRHRVWIKKNSKIRNEPLDCRVYSLCALDILKPNMKSIKKKHLNRILRLEPDEIIKPDSDPVQSTLIKKRRTLKSKRSKGFANNW